MSIARTFAFTLPITLSIIAVVAGPAIAQQPPPVVAGTINEPMPLTDAQLRGFFDAMDELNAKAPAGGGAKPTKPEAFAQALQISGESMPILNKHGFESSASFQRVAYNAALAYGVLKEGGKDAVKAKMDDARVKQAAGLEKIRAQLPPEQAKLIEAQAKAGMEQGSQMEKVPDENVELMKKYRDRMEKLARR